jgi:hypothetical protein|eukprot:COSAG06_NODE_2442_length_6871_cov_2.427939_2_plen_134_part_00
MVAGGCRGWLPTSSALLGLLLGAVVRAQDNTQPTADELACWEEYNGGAFYDSLASSCDVCIPGRYDHDAITNMAHMNIEVIGGAAVVTWWDDVTDYNPVRASTPLLGRGCAALPSLRRCAAASCPPARCEHGC